MAQGPEYVVMGFKSEIRKVCVVDKCTCLGMDEYGQPKGSDSKIRDGSLKFQIGYTC